MVSINKVVNVSLINAHSNNVHKSAKNVAKKVLPAIGGLAVLAGPLHYVPGDDLYRLDDPTFVPYGGEQAELVKDEIVDGITAVSASVAEKVASVGSSIVEGVGSISDSVTDVAVDVLDKILNATG